MRIFPALLLFLSLNVHAKIKVAVIDTGFDKSVIDLTQEPSNSWYEKGICKYGHKDFSGTSIHDRHGHGTNIAGLIHKYAKADYCMVIIKYYDENPGLFYNPLKAMTSAIRYAINLKVDVINISAGGIGAFEEERELIHKALSMGIKVIVAAGNERSLLMTMPELDKFIKEQSEHKYSYTKKYDHDRKQDVINLYKDGEFETEVNTYYPAMYDRRLVVVGSVDSDSERLPSSNHSSKYVDYYEQGKDQVGSYGRKLTGTSQATAIRTGKEISKMYNDMINKYLLRKRTA